MPAAPLVDVDGRRLRLTNLDKVLYPETGTTKGDVIRYYATIAPALLPHLAERPVTRKRWPDGVGSAAAPIEAFFEKDLGMGVPDWVLRQTILHSGGEKRYPVVTDRATLVWLAQIAALELHVPQWRFDIGRTAPIRTAAARALTPLLRPASGDHPWPGVISSRTYDRFQPKRETKLTLIEPLTVEISADTAVVGGTIRHAARFVRARPEIPPGDLIRPRG